MKISRSFLVAILLCIATTASIAQGWQWSQHFGGPGHDWGYIGAVDTLGNIYCYGTYAGPGPDNYFNLYIEGDTLEGNKDSFIAKFDPNGALVWVKNCVSSTDYLGISSLCMDPQSDLLYVTGTCVNSGNLGSCPLDSTGGWIAQFDLDGNCNWAKTFSNGAFGTGIVSDGSGMVYLSGLTSGPGPIIVDGILVPSGTFFAAYNEEGDIQWAKELVTGLSINGNGRYYPYQLKYHNGSILVHGAAFQYSNSGPWQVDTVVAHVVEGGGHVLMNLDASNGVARWVKPLGFSWTTQNTVLRRKMDVGVDGSIYCISTAGGDSARFGGDTAVVVPPNGSVTCLVRYDQQGEMVHFRTYNTEVGLQSIKVANDGTLLIDLYWFEGGSFDECSGPQGNYLVRTDSIGNCLAMLELGNTYGGMSLEETENAIYICSASQQFGSSNYGGEIYTTYGFEDVLLAKHDLALGVSSMQGQGNEQLVIYANPNQGTFRVKVPDAFLNRSGLQLKVIDSAGRIVHDQTLNLQGESPRMDLFDVSPGYYLVTLGNSERTYSGHMVVE